jgi:release factor glutamine methyltransferase
MGLMAEVYKSAEDTFLLLKHAEKLVEGNILEMGTGSGYIAIQLSKMSRVGRVVAVDVNPKAVETARNNALMAGVSEAVMFMESDLFQRLGDSRFNWVLFNPPYLPSEGIIDEPSWAGGRNGGELITRFLSKAPLHLSPGGRILAIISSKTNFDFRKVEKQYEIKVLEEIPLFFETLSCVMFVPLALLESDVKSPDERHAERGMDDKVCHPSLNSRGLA